MSRVAHWGLGGTSASEFALEFFDAESTVVVDELELSHLLSEHPYLVLHGIATRWRVVQVGSWARTCDESMGVREIRVTRRLPLMDWRCAIWMIGMVRGRIPELGWNVELADGARETRGCTHA